MRAVDKASTGEAGRTGGARAPQSAPALLGLQRTAGNAAASRLVAVQRDDVDGTPTDTTDEIEATRRTSAAPWRDPRRAALYPHRTEMLRRMVGIGRLVDYQGLTGDELWTRTAEVIRQRVDWLTQVGDGSAPVPPQRGGRPERGYEARVRRALAAQAVRLNGVLARAEAPPSRGTRAARERARRELVGVATEHVRAHVELSGEDLERAAEETGREILRLARPQLDVVLSYAGVRYQSAHGSYAPPQRLVRVLAESDVATGAELPSVLQARLRHRRSPVPVPDLDDAAAALRVRELLADHGAPGPVVRLVVRVGHLPPAAGDAALVDGPIPANWAAILQRWRRGTTTAWLPRAQRDAGGFVLPTVVCNQLAEVFQASRGVRLPGGIARDAESYAGRAAQAAGRRIVNGTDADARRQIVPGAGLFFIGGRWSADRPERWSAVVEQNPPLVLPVPVGPTDPASRAWNRQVLPADGQRLGGGVVSRRPGEYVSVAMPDRSRLWMTWAHEATVLLRFNDHVAVLETTDPGSGGDDPRPTAGVTLRSVSELLRANVFIATAPEGAHAVQSAADSAARPGP